MVFNTNLGQLKGLCVCCSSFLETLPIFFFLPLGLSLLRKLSKWLPLPILSEISPLCSFTTWLFSFHHHSKSHSPKASPFLFPTAESTGCRKDCVWADKDQKASCLFPAWKSAASDQRCTTALRYGKCMSARDTKKPGCS